MQRVPCIMLIDDDEGTNFLHKLIIEEANCCDELLIFDDALEALNSLKAPTPRVPNLIFLDINMPRMNGWQFLEEYKLLPPYQHTKPQVVMLTTSINPIDKQNSANYEEIIDFLNKPLSIKTLRGILQAY